MYPRLLRPTVNSHTTPHLSPHTLKKTRLLAANRRPEEGPSTARYGAGERRGCGGYVPCRPEERRVYLRPLSIRPRVRSLPLSRGGGGEEIGNVHERAKRCDKGREIHYLIYNTTQYNTTHPTHISTQDLYFIDVSSFLSPFPSLRGEGKKRKETVNIILYPMLRLVCVVGWLYY